MNKKAFCPFLPQPETDMNHGCLTSYKSSSPRQYYYNALKYGNFLWSKGYAGRAILAVARALYTRLPEHDSIYSDWPLPYPAIHWIVANHGSDEFPGNPRISFAHQATRMKPSHGMTKRARAWAAWAVVCHARPSLPGDSTDPNTELNHLEIEELLLTHGHSGEAEQWKRLLL
jgi:hypothetical protein